MASNPKTVNEITKIFRDIATNHRQIEDFGYGDFSEMGTSKSINYPLMWMNYGTETIFINDSAGNPTHIEMDIEFRISDKINNTINTDDNHGEESNNALEITSDIVQIKRDIVAQLTQHSFYMNNGITIRTDITDELFYDAGTDVVNEIRFILTLRFPFNLTVCGSPFKNIIISPDIDYVSITDALNPSSPLKRYAGDNYTCTSASGIAYQRPPLTGQDTSFATYDDNWHRANGTYDYTPPVYPVSYALLDTTATYPFETLVHNNFFGNKYRFTDSTGDSSGVATTAEGYFIDHLTGLGYKKVQLNNLDFLTALSTAQALSFNGFDDWRVVNIKELYSLFWYETGDGLNYSPINISGARYSCTTRIDNTDRIYGMTYPTGLIFQSTKINTALKWCVVRNHYN